jgi:hypothetical protein
MLVNALIKTTSRVIMVADHFIFKVLTAINNATASMIGNNVIAIIDSVTGFKLKLKCDPSERGSTNK